MKKFVFILLPWFLSNSYGQVTKKNCDLILVIDEHIAIGSIWDVKINISQRSKEVSIAADYYPGNLSIANEDYASIICNETNTIYLSFSYREYVRGQQDIYNYKIEIKKEWLRDKYNILSVYNLNKDKYKGKFDTVTKGQNYVYELDSPSNTFKLIRK